MSKIILIIVLVFLFDIFLFYVSFLSFLFFFSSKRKEKRKKNRTMAEQEEKREGAILRDPSLLPVHPQRHIGRSGGGEAEFRMPCGIACDHDHNDRLFIPEFNSHRLQCIGREGQFQFTFGPRGRGEGQTNYPQALGLDPARSRLLLVDAANHRVQTFDLCGSFLFAFGSRGSGPGQFDWPSGVAVDGRGRVWVTDYYNHRVQAFSEEGEFLFGLGEEGDGEGQLRYPQGIAARSDGGVVVAEKGNGRLSVFDSRGCFAGFVGQGLLAQPGWICVDPADRLLVPDWELAAVVVFSPQGRELARLGGKDVFFEVFGAAVGRGGEIFVSALGKDHEFRIFVF